MHEQASQGVRQLSLQFRQTDQKSFLRWICCRVVITQADLRNLTTYCYEGTRASDFESWSHVWKTEDASLQAHILAGTLEYVKVVVNQRGCMYCL